MKFQNQGIGRVAMVLALHEIKQTAGLQEIEICYNPSNPEAEALAFMKSGWMTTMKICSRSFTYSDLTPQI
ncbi:hypothetical protein [Paraglaciecola chathamensis]|uniref:hypothetical protein n=1 Tax=Paraglaciecola chathamensis TaxID=368405 RepID=UPI003CC82272|tara:strand:- start:122218 stop:122430 length:213 start_codon:yes stop_codon:yes gene_type:complete